MVEALNFFYLHHVEELLSELEVLFYVIVYR